MGDAGGGGKELRVGGGHRGGKDAGDYDARDDGGECAVRRDERRGVDDQVLRLGLGAGHRYRSGLDHAEADDTDYDRGAEGNDDPDGGDAAAEVQLTLAADGHEVQQDVRHAEVAESPRQRGRDHQGAVAAGGAGEDARGRGEIEVAGDLLGVGDDGVPAAGGVDAEYEHDDKRYRHNDALNKARDGCCHEAAGRAVDDDDGSADYHGGHVVEAEEAVEELAAGGKARGRIGHEEDYDRQRAESLDYLGVVAEAAGKEIRHGYSVDARGVAAQALCDDEPVEIGAQRKADGRPARLRDAAEERQSRHAHQQIRAHIRRLSAHGGDYGAELAAAEIEVLGGAVVCIFEAYRQHAQQIDDHCYKNPDHCRSHNTYPRFS